VSGRCGLYEKCTISTQSLGSSDMLVSACLITAKPFFSVGNGDSITFTVNILPTASNDRISGFNVRGLVVHSMHILHKATSGDSPHLYFK
jgi:hypothetical protein